MDISHFTLWAGKHDWLLCREFIYFGKEAISYLTPQGMIIEVIKNEEGGLSSIRHAENNSINSIDY